MKCLIVVDMQDKYIGVNSKYSFDREILIHNIKKKIDSYDGIIVYVINYGKGNPSNVINEILINNPIIFEKKTSSIFSNEEFVLFLKEKKVTRLEVIGIEGNCCVKSTAIGGAKLGYDVSVDLSCVGILNNERFIRTKEKLKASKIQIIE